MPYAALELLPDDAGQAVVRRDWQRLRDVGLPSQLDHRGATNAPHLTLLAGPSVTAAVDRATELMTDLLPLEVRGPGLLLLGGERLTVARAVDVPDALLAVRGELSALVPDQAHLGWLPHLTLARRLPRERVGEAVDVLGRANVVLRLTVLRHWDPRTGTATTLVGPR